MRESTRVYLKIANKEIPTLDELAFYTNALSKADVLEIAAGKAKLSDVFYEICDHVHASCDDQCPVYDLMSAEQKENWDCPHFKDPKSMIRFIKSQSKKISREE